MVIVSLGEAALFSVLCPNIIANGSNDVINGDVGYNTLSGSGSINALNGENPATNEVYSLGIADLNIAISYIGIQNYVTTSTTDIGSLSPLNPGSYLFTSAVSFSSTLTLSGSGQYVFYFMVALNINLFNGIILLNGASSSNIFFYCPYNITFNLTNNSTIYGNFISDQDIIINNSIGNGVQIDGRILSTTGTLQITNSIVDNSDISCYTEDCNILLFDGTFKPIKDLLPDDKILVYGIFDCHMNLTKFNTPTFTTAIFLGKITIYNPTSNNYPIQINSLSNSILVSPEHRIIINNNSTYAKHLGEPIKTTKITYYHILCNKHYAINVNNFITETMHSYTNNLQTIFNNITSS